VTWSRGSARPEQLPPDTSDWLVWLYLAGRGAGKTRSAAEWLAYQAIRRPNTRWAIIAPTFGDCRDTCLEGVSGLLRVIREYGMLAPDGYNRSLGQVRLSNGSRIRAFSGAEPDRLRGPQHHGGWVDELAAIRYDSQAWDQYQFGLRLGDNPQTAVTTTPRPRRILRSLLERNTTFVTRGSTFDNAANLAPAALAELRLRYEGTRLGHGELLQDVEGALWTGELIETYRVDQAPQLVRIVVGVDPAGTASGDATGIVVAGRTSDGHAYVLHDATLHGSPDQWGRAVARVYDQHGADLVVVERNYGGDMVEAVLRSVRSDLPITTVTATQGKHVRAEPVSALYEQGRVHHVGVFPDLEDQMTSWTVDDPGSPDRMDALVWAVTNLLRSSNAEAYLAAISQICPACGTPNTRQALGCVRCGNSLEGAS
jgi:predicted phage terminase large subunit-like protein